MIITAVRTRVLIHTHTVYRCRLEHLGDTVMQQQLPWEEDANKPQLANCSQTQLSRGSLLREPSIITDLEKLTSMK